MGNARTIPQAVVQLLKSQRLSSRASAHHLQTRHASTATIGKQPLKLIDGKAVLYRGPPAMANWAYFSCGSVFAGVGLMLSYNLYNHLTWPLTWKDPANPPKLANEWTRRLVASAAGAAGSVTAFLFFAVPTRTITKITLDATARELIIRTASRGISAFLPMIIMRGPFRQTAQLRGFYKTNRNDERVVPLSSVYRIRGSANEAAIKPVKLDSRGRTPHQGLDERKCLEIKIGTERSWYRLETAGGSKPPTKGFGFLGFTRRIQHVLRGKADWDGEKPLDVHLGKKEPWFADRRTFDDVVPLIKRR